MIKINKITDETLIKSFLSQIDGLVPQNFIGVFDNDDLLEFAGYTFTDNCLNIDYISENSNEFSLYDGIVKTLIFYADIKQTNVLKIPSEYDKIIKAFKFELINGEYIFDVFKQNTKPCECCGKEN